MKKMKHFISFMLAMVMVLAMSMSAMAASITINSTTDSSETNKETTEYTYYKILDATIEDASKITVNPETGESTAGTGENAPKVVYYVTTEDKATAIDGTGLFNVVKDATQDKWYVELKDATTTAEAIATALDGIKRNFQDVSGTFAQTTPGGTATKDGLDAGYYLITSTLGDKLAVQTLADIEINTKNSYPAVNKTIDETDMDAQIGDEINYTLTVVVPNSANDQIVLTDTMNAGLTFNSINSVKNNEDEDVTYTLNPVAPSTTDKEFTITFSADVVKANKGKTITILYTAILNKDAAIETGIPNTIKLNYGNHYESVQKTVNTKTYKFDFDKVDGADKTTKLVGAEFELQLSGVALNLVEVEAGKTYRIATSEDTTTTTKIVTNGNTVTVNGLDTDVTYTLVEKKAPTGYNKLDDSIEVEANDNEFISLEVENNKGSVLPSTGGVGTTMFYVIGGALVLVAVVLLVTRKRMSVEK